MGDSQNAAAELVEHPRFVAVHENLLARVGVILAHAVGEGTLSQLDYDSITAEMDEARALAERARGGDADAPVDGAGW